SVGDERPHVLVVRLELLRHWHGEHAPLAAGEKVRRLPHVGPAGLDPVVGADGNVEFLRGVAVVVADEERARAVLVVVPPFERAREAAARAAARLGNRGGHLPRNWACALRCSGARTKTPPAQEPGGANNPE